MSDAIHHFLSAVLGSLVVEIFRAYSFICSGRLPKRYRQFSFYLVCFLASIAAGVLSLMLPCNTNTSAFLVGASAPRVIELIVKKFLQHGSL